MGFSFTIELFYYGFIILVNESAKWLSKETLDLVDWLPADLGLIAKLKKIL